MTPESHDYKDLKAWKESKVLAFKVYMATKAFPKEEIYGLTNQVRRAAISVPSNIAEGQGRGSKREFVRALRIAKGSLCEVETQLLIAEDLEYLPKSESVELAGQASVTGMLINGLIRSLQKGLV